MSLITLRLLLISISLFFPETFCYRQLVSDLTEIRQSSTYENNVASRAIDGGSGFSMSSGSCSHTGVGQSEAWLRIDLKKVYSINTIEILYRNDRGSDLVNTQRLHGYSLQYYDNEWKECYRDSTPDNVPIPMQSTVPCRQHTQYIRIYTYTPSPNDQYVFLEICEVKILGCDVHQYGKNCTHCSNSCNKCDIVNGCVECKPRFYGENCESCTAKWYNEDCFQKCSDNCPNDETCNEVKGNCPGRCLPGYRGAICEQKCSGGMYGFKCMNTCDTCVNMSCDHITGSCDHGCTEGWTGDLCVEECSNGTYGFQCKNTCDTCVNMSCDHVNGSCDVGCIDGWTGEMCGKVCPEGHYGHNCSGQCQNCENETCNHVSGSCQGLCKEGWGGDKCQEALKTSTVIFPFIYVLNGACGSILVVYIVIIIVVVVRKRQRKRPCNSKLNCIRSVSASSNRQNLNSSQNPRKQAENRNQNDVIEEPMYCNIELLTKHDMDSCSLKKPHLDEAIVSKKSIPSVTKVMSNDTLIYEDTNSNNDVDAETASRKKPLRVKSRKETNCLAVKEESYPKKNGKRRPDQKIPVCNVYSTSLKACQHQTVGKTAQPPCREGTIQKACPQLTGGTTYQPCKEGMSPKACQQRTGGTKVNPLLKESKSPKACTQRTEGKTANPPLKEGMTPKACPQQTGGEKAYPPLKEGTCTTAFQQLTGGKTAFQTLKEGMTPNACPQQTGGKTAYPPLKEDTSPKAYQQQSDCLEEAIYLNNELETCDTGESLVWDGEETMYWNTGVASDRSSDSSGYIKMTL